MRKKIVLALIIGLHLFFLFNLQFTAWPEMFSFPYLVNHGFGLYSDMIHPYPPLLTITLAKLFAIFGYKASILRAVTYFIVLINDIFIVKIVAKLTKEKLAPIFALITYVVLQPFLEGNMLWFDIAFVPFILAGIYLLVCYISVEKKKRNYNYLLAAGIAFSLAGFVKQNSFIFPIFTIIYLWIIDKNRKELKYLMLAPLFLGSIFILKLFSEGVLDHFLNWTLVFPSIYWTKFPGYVDMVLGRRESYSFLLIFVPLLIIAFHRKVIRKELILLLLLLAGSIFTIYPRFSFFHFQMGIAILAILTAILLVNKRMIYYLYIVVLIVVISIPTIRTNWNKETRFLTKADIANYEIIKARTSGKVVYLLGLNSYNYVYSNSLPPKPWLDNFGWYFEIPGVQTEVLNKWEDNLPDKVVVSQKQPGNWYDLGTYRPIDINNWIIRNYNHEEQLSNEVMILER